MNCVIDPGPSTKGPPEGEIHQHVEELVDVTQNDAMDSPSFSSSSFSGDTTTVSSENVTDQEQDHAPPAKKRRGRPPKVRQHVVPEVVETKPTKAKAKRGRQPKEKVDEDPKPKKKRTRKPKPALSTMSKFEQSGSCLSQKVCKKPPRRRTDSPDAFANDDEEFERVTQRLTAPRKRTIEAFHHATVFYMNHVPVAHHKEALKLMPFDLIEKYHKEPDAGIIKEFPNDSKVFKE